MTNPIHRPTFPFAFTHANEFELIAGFMLAARSAGWTHEAVLQTLDEAMSDIHGSLHITFSQWCLPLAPETHR